MDRSSGQRLLGAREEPTPPGSGPRVGRRLGLLTVREGAPPLAVVEKEADHPGRDDALSSTTHGEDQEDLHFSHRKANFHEKSDILCT